MSEEVKQSALWIIGAVLLICLLFGLLPLLLDVLAAHGIDWTPPPSGIFGCIPLSGDCDAQQSIEQVAEPLGLLAIPCSMFAPQLSNQIRIGWGAPPEEFQQSLAAFDEFLGRLA